MTGTIPTVRFKAIRERDAHHLENVRMCQIYIVGGPWKRRVAASIKAGRLAEMSYRIG
jgi:hypothetical protein